MNIKPCDIVFVWGTTFANRAVEFGTHGPSHVALVKDINTLVEADGGRNVGEQSVSFYDNDTIEIWRDLTLTDAERTSALKYAQSLYGTPYDWGLIAVEAAHELTGMDDSWYHEKGRLICSTFVDAVGHHIGRSWSRCTNPAPVDLMTSGMLNKIYRRERQGGTE